jgi:hypothetical protein
MPAQTSAVWTSLNKEIISSGFMTVQAIIMFLNLQVKMVSLGDGMYRVASHSSSSKYVYLCLFVCLFVCLLLAILENHFQACCPGYLLMFSSLDRRTRERLWSCSFPRTSVCYLQLVLMAQVLLFIG